MFSYFRLWFRYTIQLQWGHRTPTHMKYYQDQSLPYMKYICISSPTCWRRFDKHLIQYTPFVILTLERLYIKTPYVIWARCFKIINTNTGWDLLLENYAYFTICPGMNDVWNVSHRGRRFDPIWKWNLIFVICFLCQCFKYCFGNIITLMCFERVMV